MDIRYGRKRSGIIRELKKKIQEWLDSITDPVVRKAAEEDVIVTGGAICSMLMGDKVNDFDLYFRTKVTTRLVAEYYVGKFNETHLEKLGERVRSYEPVVREESLINIKGMAEDRVVIYIKSAGVVGEGQDTYHYFESMPEEATKAFAESLKENSAGEKYRVTFMSQNAITLSDKVQLVTRFYGDPKEIHDNYDFIHATCYWDHKNKRLELPADAMEAMLSRTLVYKGSLYPIASIFRTKKFLERGWRITAGQQLKIMWQISEIDLSDHVMLREQLTGVDAAYMHQLITALEDVDPKLIDAAYVSNIIDLIFD